MRVASFFMLLALLCMTGVSAQSLTAGTPKLFLIGDSTVNNHTKGQVGWGDALQAHFDAARITVVNRARGGRSSRSFRTEGLWAKALAEMRSGDYLLMQFGHNDGGGLSNPRTGNRASVKGDGDETQEWIDPATGAKETVHTYGWYLRSYLTEAKAKGVTAIVLSPVPRKIWTAHHKVARASADYGLWARDAARRAGAPFIDLNDLVARRYEAMGQTAVEPLFADEHTHTTAAGADLNAECVCEGIAALKGCALGGDLLPRRPAVGR